MLDSDFYKKLIQVSQNVGMKPEDILKVMASESGLNPSSYNKDGGASGLIQFMPSTMKSVGYSGDPKKFKDLQAAEQLDYVEKFIKNQMKINGGPFKSAEQYYVGNFLPAALKIPGIKNNDLSTIIVAENPTSPHIPGVSIANEAMYYKHNKGLDVDKDGAITLGDLKKKLDQKEKDSAYIKALKELKSISYQPTIKRIIQNEDKESPSIFDTLTKFIKTILAEEKNNKYLYEKYLDKNKFVIKLANNVDPLEFGNTLTNLFEKHMLAKCDLCKDKENIEVIINCNGDKDLSKKIIEEITADVSSIYNVSYEIINKQSIFKKASHIEILKNQNKFKEKYDFRK